MHMAFCLGLVGDNFAPESLFVMGTRYSFATFSKSISHIEKKDPLAIKLSMSSSSGLQLLMPNGLMQTFFQRSPCP